MAKQDVASAFDGVLERLERRMEVMQKLQLLVEQDPGVVPEILSVLKTLQRQLSGGTQQVSNRRGGAYATILELMRSPDYVPSSLDDIAVACSLSRSAVATVIYKQSPERFTSKKNPNNRRQRLWWLSTPSDEETAAEGSTTAANQPSSVGAVRPHNSDTFERR